MDTHAILAVAEELCSLETAVFATATAVTPATTQPRGVVPGTPAPAATPAPARTEVSTTGASAGAGTAACKAGTALHASGPGAAGGAVSAEALAAPCDRSVPPARDTHTFFS